MLEFLSRQAGLREKIVSGKCLGERKLDSLLLGKKREFAGLLSDDAALYLVANSLGVEAEGFEPVVRFTPLAELAPGGKASVRCRVERVSPLKGFERDGRKGSLVSLAVSDGTGSARLVLWGFDAERVSSGSVEKGDLLEVLNAEVREGLGGAEIQLGMTGTLRRAECGERKGAGIGKLSDGCAFDGTVRVMELCGERELGAGARKSRMAWCIVGDESGSARMVLWEPACGIYAALAPGCAVTVEGGEGRKAAGGGVELHVTSGGRVFLSGRRAFPACAKPGGRRLKLLEAVAAPEGACGRAIKAVFGAGGERVSAELSGGLPLKLLLIRKAACDIWTGTLLGLKLSGVLGKEFFAYGEVAGGVLSASDLEPATSEADSRAAAESHQ